MDTKIWATLDKSFDIGCPVVKWDEPTGYNFLPLKKYTQRNITYEQLKTATTQFTTHWSATYRAKHTFQGLVARGLSVAFIMDDDNVDGYATIYQCLPLVHAGWSQGDGFNGLGAGVEVSYQPGAWGHDMCAEGSVGAEGTMYDANDQKKWGVPPHQTVSAPIHGTTLRVHLPTQAQMNSLVQLIWGYCSLFPKVKPFFPKPNNSYLTTTLPNPQTYSGLVTHFHLKRGKIDVAGLDMKWIEEEVSKRMKVGY